MARQGAGRGLAEHWGCLKYCQALEGEAGNYVALSAEGRNPERHYKSAQSGELGIGFAAVLAEQVLKHRYPGHSVSIIDSDIALLAGWALTGKGKRPEGIRRRPTFLMEAWKPGEPSKVVLVASKGAHGNASQVHRQLACAAAHVHSVQIGAYDQTPALMVGTELAEKGGIVLHALQAPGDGSLRVGLDHPGADLDLQLSDQTHKLPEICLPGGSGGDDSRVPGFQILPEDDAWFRRVIARAEAAGLMAFTGGGKVTAQYLTERQGKRHFTLYTHAGTGSVQDVNRTINGVGFAGTDHVFRLNGTRVEAFSGLTDGLFDHLALGRVEEYRREAHALRSTWPGEFWDPDWGGPVSLRDDGSVMAMRLLGRRRG
ncbi:hypothetical protein [Streptomyces olivaceiscleroticus]|uniref:Tryptophan synthase beta chain-like PALP domain-containing protein n=1 Tax=Streptomyces olivaceiscleroticus TaxID=68245 RepID=A0ABN1AI83_9ACTN